MGHIICIDKDLQKVDEIVCKNGNVYATTLPHFILRESIQKTYFSNGINWVLSLYTSILITQKKLVGQITDLFGNLGNLDNMAF
jgi:rRNA processing protein Gar1